MPVSLIAPTHPVVSFTLPAEAYEFVAPEASTTEVQVIKATTTLSKKEVNPLYCSCVRFAHYLNPKIPLVSAIWFQGFNNATPSVGNFALFSYGEGEEKQHIAMITAITEKGFWIREANFKKCTKDTRFIFWNDLALRGFFSP